MWYGDMEIMKNDTVGDFMGNPKGQYKKDQAAKKLAQQKKSGGKDNSAAFF